MSNRLLLLSLLFMGILSCLSAQQWSSLAKYHFAGILALGSSFPNYDPVDQSRWRAGLYTGGGITLEGIQSINNRWQVMTGIGFTTYYLNNKGPVDNYSLDFLSPHLRLGVGYLSQTKSKGRQYISQLMMGGQLGYSKTVLETFTDYQVEISGGRQIYYFVRPEWGIRWPWRKRWRRGLPNPYNECGLFYRFNFSDLGVARFTGADYTLSMQPSGNMLGGYFRVVLPAGRKRVKLPVVLPPPDIIYHPRMRD